MNRQRGFTLIEMIAVLMLVALVAGAVAFSLGSNLKGVRTKAAVRDLTAVMRYTRGLAIVQHEQRALEIDVDARTYQAPGRPLIELPEGLDMKLLTAASEQTGTARA